MNNDITILSCPICNYPKLREYGNGIYQCDFCETYFDKDENIVPTWQEWLQTCDTEQLAEWLQEHMDCASCGCNKDLCYQGYDCCKLAFLEWLKQPHKPFS